MVIFVTRFLADHCEPLGATAQGQFPGHADAAVELAEAIGWLRRREAVGKAAIVNG